MSHTVNNSRGVLRCDACGETDVSAALYQWPHKHRDLCSARLSWFVHDDRDLDVCGACWAGLSYLLTMPTGLVDVDALEAYCRMRQAEHSKPVPVKTYDPATVSISLGGERINVIDVDIKFGVRR